MGWFPFIAFLALIFQLELKGCADAASVNCSASDLEALLDFKQGLFDPDNRLISWRARSDCCSWRGVACDERTGAVHGIHLRDSATSRYGLSGEIKPSLLRIKSLRYLDLSFNTFEGIKIPQFFGSLHALRYLNLSHAGFSSELPANLRNLSRLEYLDVSSNLISISDFEWVSGLVSLKHLMMNQVDLSLVNSNWLENINMLPNLLELSLSSCDLYGSIPSLGFVNLTSLAVLDLSFNFGIDSMFPNWLINVSTLEYADFTNCGLKGRIPLGLAELPWLKHLNLALTGNLTAACHELFKGSWKSIEFLDISSNKLHGKLPDHFGNLTSLKTLTLADNDVEGGLPSTIGGLCCLETFVLSGNNLTVKLPEFLIGMEACKSSNALTNLSYLALSNNQIPGTLPNWLSQLRSLQYLDLAVNMIEGTIPSYLGNAKNLTHILLWRNRLEGTLPVSFSLLTELVILDVSFNQLNGILTESHFAQLTNLKIFHLSGNSMIFNVSFSWIAPFQIRYLDLASCQLGPPFPAWLESQKGMAYLDLSNSSISGSIPQWFWDVSSNLSLLNVSLNQLEGQLPSPMELAPYASVDFSFNNLSGSVPLSVQEIVSLDLSNNHFQGSIPQNISQSMPNLIFLSLSSNELSGEIPDTIGDMSLLQVINLSMNSLTGSIPQSIGNCPYLKVLDLGNNNVSGTIPDSLGLLYQLQSLHLNDNLLRGALPISLKNLSHLETLDLENNMLSGSIPPWLAYGFLDLRILNLRLNAFSGGIPSDISNLRSLQVLDLAGNDLTGKVPEGLGNLKAMAEEYSKITKYLFYGSYQGVYYEERLVVNLKNQTQMFSKTLSLLKAIDLSGNNFVGEFPESLTRLSGLVVLNLSRNQISGQIPSSISNMRQLSSLDLSTNRLHGPIPSSMTSLSFLSYLNLSDNNLSGQIPYKGQLPTFLDSSFLGNSQLCGAPLGLECQNGNSSNGSEINNGNENDDFIDIWFYLSLALGFLVGAAVPFIILVVRRPWGYVYLNFVDKIVSRLQQVLHCS